MGHGPRPCSSTEPGVKWMLVRTVSEKEHGTQIGLARSAPRTRWRWSVMAGCGKVVVVAASNPLVVKGRTSQQEQHCRALNKYIETVF